MRTSTPTLGCRHIQKMACLALACLVCIVWGMSIGLPEIGVREFLSFLAHGLSSTCQPTELRDIFLDIRMPRVLLALVAGAGLALSGVGAQAVLGNPLVSPSILGLSAGASFGASLVILYGGTLYLTIGQGMLMAAAFCMAMLAVLLTYALSAIRNASRETVILAGVAVSYIFSGATIFLQYLAPYHDLRAIVFWTVGSLWNAEPVTIAVLGPLVLLCAIILFSRSITLNSLSLGEETATSVGVNVPFLRLSTLLLCALLCASIVSFTGAIGFVGLIAPHLARSFFGQDHRWLIPGSFLCGALILLLADNVARAFMWPEEIPVGVMTSLIGGPFFLFQLVRKSQEWRL